MVNNKNNNQISLEDLAVMIKNGFDGNDKRFDNIDEQFSEVNQRLDDLDTGQESIKLRLDNVAYRFELQELEQRIALLEHKAGIRS